MGPGNISAFLLLVKHRSTMSVRNWKITMNGDGKYVTCTADITHRGEGKSNLKGIVVN